MDDDFTGSTLGYNDSELYADLCSIPNNFSNLCNNTTTTAAPTSTLPLPLWLTIVLGTAAAVVVIVTVLGNILVLLSFVLERSIRQPTNYFIASLAMSDLLIGTFSMPCFTIYLLLGRWPLGEIICDLWLSLDWTVCLASQYTVFFITADRFCSVKIPAKYRNWRTDRKVRIMIALSWTIPSVVFFTSIIGWQYFVGERTVKEGTCEVQFMSDPLFTFLLTIGYYWTTLIVMVTLYGGIYRVALSLQRKSNEKQRKLNHAMELSKKKTNKPGGGAKSKESKKRIENNNARYMRGAHDNNTLTTSFSKHSDNEYSKPSEEDRSSSPAFASDEDEESTGELKKEQCYVNSAVQTEPTLKGLLGSSANHMSRLAFSLSGTSVSASHASSSGGEKEFNDENQTPANHDQNKPLLNESGLAEFEPIKDEKSGFDGVIVTEVNEELDKLNESATPLIESDVLDGIKYIDEDSLKSLTSTDNVKLLAEIKELSMSPSHKNEAESPVWRKRNMDDDKSLLVPHSADSASSEAISSVMDNAIPQQGHDNKVCNDRKTECHRVSSNHKCRKDDQNRKHNLSLPNHDEKKSKDSKPYGSPLQSLVRSLRPSGNKKPKQAKSKSENRARKALRTISIILGAYVLCWTPYHVMVFIIGVCQNWSCINLQFYYFTYWLCYLNSPINPFCYAFANAQFKRTFIRILKLDLHRT
ncbi:G-protein coupled acetylcholine receptor [Mactra antiquata]